MEVLVWCSLIFGYLLKTCIATGLIELRLVQYDVTSGTMGGAGLCCDYRGNMGKQPVCPANECDPYLYICIQDVIHLGGCPMGEAVTGFTTNNDHVTFTDTVGHNRTANPIIFYFNGGYGGVLIPKITTYDEDRTSGAARDDKIDYLQHVISRVPDYNNSREHVVPISMKGQVSTLQLEINVRCDADFYGDDCQRYCVPDSESYCDPIGQLVCRPGAPCDPTRPMTPPPTTSTTTTAATTKASTMPVSTATRTTVSTTAPSTRPQTTAGTEPSTTPTLAPFPDFRHPTAEKPTSPAAVTSSTSPTSKTTSRPPASKLTSTTVSSSTNVTTPSAHSTKTTSATTTTMPPYVCHFNQSSGSNTGGIQISIPSSSDVNVVQSRVISRLAPALNMDTKSLQLNATLIANTSNESYYEIFALDTVTHQVINGTTLRHVVTDVCGNYFSAQTADKTSPDDGSNTATIAGVVSGVVLLGALTPALAFLYRRKCRHSKVADEDTERTIQPETRK